MKIDLKTLREKFPEVYEREVAQRSRGGSTARASAPSWLPERAPDDRGPWIVEMPGWRPPSLRSLLYRHWSTASRHKRQAEAAIAAACVACGIPRAAEPRVVSIRLTLPNGRQPDEDNVMKVVRDGLVSCGALVDDSREWCRTGEYPAAVRGPTKTELVIGLVADGD